MLSFETGFSLDCFTVCSATAKPLILCALHGTSTEIQVYNYPDKELVATLKDPVERLRFGLISVSRDGKHMATINKVGPSFLCYWDLEAQTVLSETEIADDYTFLSFNPFNKAQLVTGHNKRATVWNVGSFTEFQKPQLNQYEVSVEAANKVERQIQAHTWLGDGKLIFSSPTGELMLCNVGKFLQEKLQKQQAQFKSHGHPFGPGTGAGGQAALAAMAAIPGLGARVPESRAGYSWDADSEEAEKMSLTVVASRLPFAYDDKAEESEEDEGDEARQNRQVGGAWGRNKGAVVYAMAITARHLVVGTEDGSVLWLNSTTYRVAYVQRFDKHTDPLTAVCCLAFNPSYTNFVSLNLKGQVQLVKVAGDVSRIEHDYKTDEPIFQQHLVGTFPLAVSARTGKPIKYGVKVLPGGVSATDLKMVTYGSNGVVSIWAFARKNLTSTFVFKTPITCLTTSPDGMLIVVGLRTGVVAVLDASRPVVMRLVHTGRYHKGPVLSVSFNREGDIFSSLGKDAVYFIRGGDFKVLGYSEHDAYLRSEKEKEAKFEAERINQQYKTIEAENAAASAAAAQAASNGETAPPIELKALPELQQIKPPLDSVINMCWVGFPEDSDKSSDRLVLSTKLGCLISLTPPNTYHDTSDLVLPESFTKPVKTVVGLAARYLSASPRPNERNIINTLTEDKLFNTFIVDDEGTCTSAGQASGHARSGCHFSFSTNGIVATGGSDGQVLLRNSDDKQPIAKFTAHNASLGGVNEVAFSDDGTYLLTAGHDGGVFCWNVSQVKTDAQPHFPPKAPITIRTKVLEGMESVEEPGRDAPLFLDAASSGGAVSADSRQKNLREQLIKSLDRFKKIFQAVLQRNENAPDMERLSLNEFAVDLELRDKLVADGEQRVKEVREEITSQYKGKELIADRIKQQCWNSMTVKGKLFKGFKTDIEVSNFPLRTLSEKETRKISQIQFLRRMQILETQWIENSRSDEGGEKIFTPSTFTSETNYLKNVVNPNAADDTKQEDGKDNKDDKKKEKKPAPITDGDEDAKKSSDELFPPFLLYHPLTCITGIRKRSQAVLLKVKIEHLQRQFNTKFESHYDLKETEIATINEKAKRIAEIQDEMQMTAEIYRPKLSPDEIPETILTVQDSEVKSVKVLSKEEQEAKERREEEARRKALEDDGPERALQDFMNGTLEAKRDLSLLEAELVREEWMELPQDEMTDEQKTEYTVFLKKVEQIRVEKETRRKLLQTELTKLKGEVADICKNFDLKAKALIELRVSTLSELYQHELMIIKLMNDIVWYEKQKEEERALEKRIGELERLKTDATLNTQEFKHKAETFTRQYEQLQTEEKFGDRNFRKDFSEAGDHLDYLTKLFRQRRKPAAKNPRKDNATASGATSARSQHDDKNPKRSTSALDMDGTEEGVEVDELVETLQPLPALESESVEDQDPTVEMEMPEEMDEDVWERFLQRRQAQIDKENQVKEAAKKHYDIQRHLVHLQNVENALKTELHALQTKRNELVSEVAKQALDTEIMLKIRQGQVEIEESPVVTDLKDCEMIQKFNVEDLNKVIQKYGGEKIDVLKDISVSRTAINILKWTKKKLVLEHKDAVDLTTELQLLRVTKSLQSLIKMGGHDNQKAAELKRLDRKIEFLNVSTREKCLGKKLKMIGTKKKIRMQTRENERLLETVQELEAAVRERVQISTIRDGEDHDDRKAADARMKALVTRRKLVDLAKLQAEEIKFLRDQVESLRKRTFASFAVPHLPANPDESRLERSATRMSRPGTVHSSRGPSRAQTR